MKVLLAGYNVDTEVIEDLKKTSRSRQDVTPETLSASYARISRDPRPIDELRAAARQEVEKARKSNSAIIFKMGHHSIAEHAVFNFDIIDVSRLALEEIEKFRLCSYTEKSQRYQKLEDNYLVPDEIKGTKVEALFIGTIKQQNDFYQLLIGKGVEPEDARYVTSLATYGQLGLTINARNLEFAFRRFASNPSSEIQQLGRKMYGLAHAIAPSIILFAEANDYDRLTYKTMGEAIKGPWRPVEGKGVGLVNYTKAADEILVAALLHTAKQLPYKDCLVLAKKMGKRAKIRLIESCFKYAEFYDRPLREFEFIDLTFDLVVSAACFGQLKRHRMMSLTVQNYNPALGATMPPAVKKAGAEKEFGKIVKITNDAFVKINQYNSLAAQYVLTNAHRRRVLVKINARELYHFSRLREDVHAQWDIQHLSAAMTAGAKKVMPLAMLFIGGKDKYPQIFEAHFGREPNVRPL
ncbi:MAG: FAD-dependent thymidylate synthase [Candidatus Margulisbacteria bacterium]|nr:FAD-dependent thymidylate synthase [Candidatus Margulisiibacteriota bacterium]